MVMANSSELLLKQIITFGHRHHKLKILLKMKHKFRDVEPRALFTLPHTSDEEIAFSMT